MNHILSGEYHSTFKGRGMTFSEVRNYQFGDEVRTIDWNVTARYNEPYIKVFEEERDLTVMLIVDISGSTAFGSQEKTKKELAVELAAILSFSAIANNDKVGLILVSDQVEKFIPPKKGKQHALLLLRELIEHQAKSTKTDINEGLRFLRNTQKKRSITFVISDFIDQNHFIEGFHLSKSKHDIIALKINDVAEFNLPNYGFIQLENTESGQTTWVDSSSEQLKIHLQQQFQEQNELLLKKFKSSGIDAVSLLTDEDYYPILVKLFKKRA